MSFKRDFIVGVLWIILLLEGAGLLISGSFKFDVITQDYITLYILIGGVGLMVITSTIIKYYRNFINHLTNQPNWYLNNKLDKSIHSNKSYCKYWLFTLGIQEVLFLLCIIDFICYTEFGELIMLGIIALGLIIALLIEIKITITYNLHLKNKKYHNVVLPTFTNF